MATFSVKFVRSAQKDLKKLPSDVQKKLLKSIVALSENPRRGNVRPMVGVSAWRLRVGDYRVIYDIDDQAVVILILKAKHRKDVYKKP